MALSRRDLLGYAVAGTTGMGITAAAREFGRGSSRANPRSVSGTNGGENSGTANATGDSRGGQRDVGQYWRLGGVQARPAEVGDTAITFRAAAGSNYDTDYEVEVYLYYRAKTSGSGDWQQIASGTAPLTEGVYLETTETGLDAGTTYQYVAEARLTNYEGPSRRVSKIREVTAGRPCSGPSTNCLRVETLAPEVRDAEVTFRGRARGLASYDEVTGHFFYWPEDGDKRWTEYVQLSGEKVAEFSTTVSGLSSGSYTYYAEVRGEGGELKNMYAEGEKRRFTVG